MKLTTVEYNDYLTAVYVTFDIHGNLRLGQHMFHLLYELHPKIADNIRGTNNDPFYNNNNIENFLKKLIQ